MTYDVKYRQGRFLRAYFAFFIRDHGVKIMLRGYLLSVISAEYTLLISTYAVPYCHQGWSHWLQA